MATTRVGCADFGGKGGRERGGPEDGQCQHVESDSSCRRNEAEFSDNDQLYSCEGTCVSVKFLQKRGLA